MYTDPIADYLTRVRNAVAANHKVVEIPASNLKKEITKILFDQGYILSYKFEDNAVQGSIKIALKYDKDTKESVIRDLQRISKPGLLILWISLITGSFVSLSYFKAILIEP